MIFEMENFKKLLNFLLSLPKWSRTVIILLLASIFVVYTLSSCAQTVRVTVRDTPNGVSISTTQNKKDSTGTLININPNISIPR